MRFVTTYHSTNALCVWRMLKEQYGLLMRSSIIDDGRKEVRLQGKPRHTWKSRSDLLLPLQWHHFLHFQPVLESHCLIIATAPKITELKKIQGIVDAILLLPMYCLFLTVLIINFHTYSYRSYAHTISPCWYKLFKTCNTILMSWYLDQVQ